MSSKRLRAAVSAASAPKPRRRVRQDGWTPQRRQAFLEALAECACVTEACRHVGLSKQSAYALRMQPDAQAFRVAWDAALDLGIRRLSDECLSRALHGVPVPHFYKGEQVGEHRRYDNLLAMFLLRYRDPLRYAATLDRMVYHGDPERAAIAFAKARHRMLDEAHGIVDLPAAPAVPPYETAPHWIAAEIEAEEARAGAIASPRRTATEAELIAELARVGIAIRPARGGDGESGWST